MTRRVLRTLLIMAVAAIVIGLSAGCKQNVVTENARTSLSSFLSGVFNEAIDDALFPGRD